MFARDFVPSEDIEQRPDDQGLLDSNDDGEALKKSRRPWYMIGAVALGVVAAAALVRSAHAPPSKNPVGSAELVTTLAETGCSEPGTSCLSTKCCKGGGKNGFQCYAKNKFWAACLETCEPGVHKGEKEGTYSATGEFVPAKWACDKLGGRSAPDPCSAPGEDCRQTKCCSAARGGTGMTCFEKDETWASCADHCADEDWTCKALGNRTRFSAGCGWPQGSCAGTNTCCNKGWVCVVQSETKTACTLVAPGWDGTFAHRGRDGYKIGDIVGGGRSEYKIAPAAPGEKVLGTSLYCFMALRLDSYELGLHNVAQENKASVFGCDGYDILLSQKAAKAGSDTDVFINVWDDMLNLGKFLKYDWTVKVDADAVLLPDRLKAHIADMRPPAGMPIYLKNGFGDAIEVLSKQAVQIYRDNKDDCRKSLGSRPGVDGYFKGCLNAIGVGFMPDASHVKFDKSPDACHNKQRAGFHPMKTVTDWKRCLDITKASTTK